MSKPLYTSASHIDTCDPLSDGCYRKWYLKKVTKLPEPPRTPTTFGDVIHAVAEKYLLADDNGRIDGNPVDLYPEGWETPINRWTGQPASVGVDMGEQALIKDLIARAIEEGVLMRVEGRKIEEPIRNWKVMDGVLINGFIDLLEPGAIRDHKSTSNIKWAKSVKPKPDGTWSKNALRNNIQMCLYGMWYYTKGGWPKDMPVTFSHQYYVKNADNPRVEKREDSSVTWEWVRTFFETRIQPVLEMMIVYRECESYEDVPLPACTQSACQKYRGCPFIGICTDRETVQGYRKRIEKEISGNNKTNYKQVAEGLKGEEKMSTESLQEKVARMRAAATAKTTKEAPKALEEKAPQKPAAASASKATPPPVNPVEETAPEGTQAAPWHRPGCTSCSGNDIQGINSKGTAPCLICKSFAAKEGRRTPDEFEWTVEDGKLIVFDKETGEQVLESSTNKPVSVKETQAPIPEPTPEPEAKVEEPPVAEETDAVLPSVDERLAEHPEAEHPEEGGPFENVEVQSERQRFTIYIGCAVTESVVKGSGKFGKPSCHITSGELERVVEGEMIKLLTPSKWAKMSSFDRKDAVRLYAENIANMVGSSYVVCTRLPKATFIEAIIESIRPYAGRVVEGIAQ